MFFVPLDIPINIDYVIPPPIFFSLGGEDHDRKTEDIERIIQYQAKQKEARAFSRGVILKLFDGRDGHYILPVQFYRLREQPLDFF